MKIEYDYNTVHPFIMLMPPSLLGLPLSNHRWQWDWPKQKPQRARFFTAGAASPPHKDHPLPARGRLGGWANMSTPKRGFAVLCNMLWCEDWYLWIEIQLGKGEYFPEYLLCSWGWPNIGNRNVTSKEGLEKEDRDNFMGLPTLW